MKYKPNWSEAKERLTALWEGRRLDRPCIAVSAPSGKDVKWPSPPRTLEQKWLDPDWIIPHALATIESTWWGSEAIPSYLLMGGWVVCLNGTPHFAENTIWFDIMEVDFDGPSPFRHDRDNPWVRKNERLYVAVAAAAGKDDFLLGSPCILPANDLLSMNMGTDRFLLALVDHPRWMRDAIISGARSLLAERRHLKSLIEEKHDFWFGNAGWMPFWAPAPYQGMQSDVSCMLSREMFEEFIVPELDIWGQEYGAMWYHLDGGDARQHLPRLLSLPYMRVIQYMPRPSEPPNGPGHLDLYREIQQAGKIVHITVDRKYIEPLVRNLDPSLLMLQTRCESIEEGKRLLEAAERWAGR